MHRYPIGVGVLLALTLCAHPAARAAGAGAYPAPDYRGPASGQSGSVPYPSGRSQAPNDAGPAFDRQWAAPAQGPQPPGYSVPAHGQPGPAPGGGYQAPGYSGPASGRLGSEPAPGGGYQAPGYSGPASGQPVPGFASGGGYQAPGDSGPAYGVAGAPAAYPQGGPAAGQQGGRPGGNQGGAELGYGYAPLNSVFQSGNRPGSGQAPGPASGNREQPSSRADSSRFNPIKTMPDPMQNIRGNRGR